MTVQRLLIRLVPLTRGFSQTTTAFGRRDKYGDEEFMEKGEFRKDRWLKRRYPARAKKDWRTANNLEEDVLNVGRPSKLPDWSFEDGEPGLLSPRQTVLRDEELRLAKEIHEAAHLVLKAQQFEKK